MKIILLTFCSVVVIGLLRAKSQVDELRISNGLIIIERLTISEADNRKVDRLRTAQADSLISSDWNFDDFRTNDKRLTRDYLVLERGFRKKGIKFKELNQLEFRQHLNAGADAAVFYLTNDYAIKEEKHFLIVTRTFKLLTLDTTILINTSAKEILIKIKVQSNIKQLTT